MFFEELLFSCDRALGFKSVKEKAAITLLFMLKCSGYCMFSSGVLMTGLQKRSMDHSVCKLLDLLILKTILLHNLPQTGECIIQIQLLEWSGCKNRTSISNPPCETQS